MHARQRVEPVVKMDGESGGTVEKHPGGSLLWHGSTSSATMP